MAVRASLSLLLFIGPSVAALFIASYTKFTKRYCINVIVVNIGRDNQGIN